MLALTTRHASGRPARAARAQPRSRRPRRGRPRARPASPPGAPPRPARRAPRRGPRAPRAPAWIAASPRCAEADPAYAAVHRVGGAREVAEPLELRRRLGRRLLRDAHAASQGADGERAGDEVLEQEPVARPEIREPRGACTRRSELVVQHGAPVSVTARHGVQGARGDGIGKVYNHSCTITVVELLLPGMDVLDEFIDIAHGIAWCSVATVDRRSRPRSRILHPGLGAERRRRAGAAGSRPPPDAGQGGPPRARAVRVVLLLASGARHRAGGVRRGTGSWTRTSARPSWERLPHRAAAARLRPGRDLARGSAWR